MIVVIKVTKACNLRCKYCYMDLEDNDHPTIMFDQVVSAIIHKFGEKYDYVDYSWHGGEPTLAGMDFYRRSISKQLNFYKNYPNKRFKNSFQTNGLNFTNKWYEFLSRNQFNLGFSCDGPDHLNINRVSITGKNVGDILRQRIKTLQQKCGYTPGIICVISKTNVSCADEIYYYFKDIGINSFSILPYQGQSEELRINSQEYFEFHKNIFDLWMSDGERHFSQIIPLAHIMSSLVGINKSICSWDGRCFSDLITVEPDGGVFLCSSLHNPEHKIGNILTESLDDIIDTQTYIQAINMQEKVLSECSRCEVFEYCKGGCREAAYFTTGRIDARDPQCEGRKELIKYILKSLLQTAKKV